MTTDPASALTELEAELAVRDQIPDLLALATAIDALGRTLAIEITRLASVPEHATPLKLVLLRVPAAHTRCLLRTAEKLDDAGSPRRAARVLIVALRKAIDSVDGTLVDAVSTALAFTFDAFAQHTATAKLNELLAIDPAASRRDRRQQHLAGVDELEATVDWNALDDELALD